MKENIVFDEKLLEDNYHKFRIETTSLNLENFNKSLNVNIKVEYRENGGPIIKSEYNKLSNRFIKNITNLLSYYRPENKQFDMEGYINSTSRILKNIYLTYYNDLITGKKLELDILEEIDIFIRLYDNYNPINLNCENSELEIFKVETQKKVDSLKALFRAYHDKFPFKV
jgi:hypothetical protein